ncbi:MAG TPA: adenylate/guanylate cyclase domain-containing protein [Vicinamibacterales bacterium]|nr:adenylate/guanylate cyclase domain-containing protein [Vicinamibacterales bacterium]
MLRLRYSESGVEKTFDVGPGTTLIGRLPSCGLVLNDPSVSRHHASVRVADGHLVIQDVGSRFGTFLNGKRVEDVVDFVPGDRLKVGDVTLQLEQHVPEQELLSEHHEVAEGPGTILRKVEAVDARPDNNYTRQLKLIAGVGRTLLSTQSLSDVLNKVVDHAFAAVPAERAFLMLRESADQALTARVLRHRDGSVPPKPTLSRMVVRRVMRDRVAMLAADAKTDPGLGVTDSILRFNIRSFMCAPLWSQDDVVGVLYVDSPRSAQFTAADLDAFTALTNAAAVAIEQARLSNQLIEEQRRRERLSRYHSPSVVSRIINASESDGDLGAQERDVTVMFCDLVGFTALCHRISPTESAALLNGFLTEMTDVVFDHEGTLDKFLGDALLAVFGAPFDQPEHPLRAVEAALAMRRALAEMNARSPQSPLEMRIAINTGTALTGDIGSPRRREFTVLGDTVNTAARMEDEIAQPGEIVIAEATYQRVKDKVKVRPLGSKVLRGRSTPLEFYAVEKH